MISASSSHLAALIEEAQSRRVRDAVVDLRFNDGGNFMLGRKFCRPCRQSFRPTAASSSSRTTRRFPPGLSPPPCSGFTVARGRRSSEKVPAIARCSGPMAACSNCRAPGCPCTRATAFHDWENGCRDPERCAWFNVLYSVPAGSLEPDPSVATTFTDYARGNDPVMRTIRERLD